MKLGKGWEDPEIVVILPVLAVTARVRRVRCRLIWSVGLALACLAALGVIACGGDETAQQEAAAPQPPTASREQASPPPERQEPETPQQESSPQRTHGDPVQLLIAEAAALERNGYWEQALSVRDSAIRSGETLGNDASASLLLDQARLLLRLDRAEESQTTLDGIDDRGLQPGSERRALLLAAQAALMLEQTDAAIEAMSQYVNSDSPAWAVVSLEAARALQRAGRGEDAIAWAERALDGTLPFQDRLRAIHLAATELDIAGEAERALAHYEDLRRLSPWRDDQAAALSRIGSLQAQLGNSDEAASAWRTLIDDYHDYSESSDALSSLLEAGAPASQVTIGRIRFREERYVDARNAMLNVLGSSDLRSERVIGEFTIAAIHEANGVLDSAALGYVAVIGRDAADPLAAESMMRLADFSVADGDLAAAEEYWRRVVFEHPGHRRAPEAARRWAMLAASRQQWSEAAQRFRDAANIGADHWPESSRAELRYWSALMHQRAGDDEAAADLAAMVVEDHPGGYFALRAAELLDQPAPRPLDISIADWLTRLTGEKEFPVFDLESEPTWQAASDLRLGGFDDAADRMLLAWLDELASDPWALVEASRFLDARSEVSASARAAERVLDLFELEWTEAPVELLRLAYPQPWFEVMALHAAAERLDPLLLWSLIRQESFYDADAAGFAGEIGLTQVIPLTGSDIAAGLGVAYQHEDLARPELGIRFGAWYLARQLEGFSNEPLFALAAYNAGPGNAARWETEALLPGPEAFLIAMDFNSTRTYVQRVLEAWNVYQALAESDE
ncbi:MAG: transglycosylase SLT domain-containing protein [Chloroflexi bacterium]|nr:transglycosylase SLT domain-containing protein [Chloroflexota bacterium]